MTAMGAKMAMAMEEAKALRAKAYALKDKRILAMLKNGATKKEVMATLHTSHDYIAKVLARAGGKP